MWPFILMPTSDFSLTFGSGLFFNTLHVYKITRLQFLKGIHKYRILLLITYFTHLYCIELLFFFAMTCLQSSILKRGRGVDGSLYTWTFTLVFCNQLNSDVGHKCFDCRRVTTTKNANGCVRWEENGNWLFRFIKISLVVRSWEVMVRWELFLYDIYI